MPAFAMLSCTSSRIPNTAQQTAAEEKTTKVNIFCTLLSSMVRGKKVGWKWVSQSRLCWALVLRNKYGWTWSVHKWLQYQDVYYSKRKITDILFLVTRADSGTWDPFPPPSAPDFCSDADMVIYHLKMPSLNMEATAISDTSLIDLPPPLPSTSSSWWYSSYYARKYQESIRTRRKSGFITRQDRWSCCTFWRLSSWC